MSQILRQSTQVVVRIGPAVAVADGFTPVTSLTLSGADEAELLKAAGAATVSIAGNTFAAITGADGWYDLTLSTTDTNTIGTLDVVVNDDSLILPIFARFQVIEEAAFDALFASSADLHTASISDIESSLVIVKSDLVVVDDLVSDVHSSLVITKSQLLIVKSDTSDIISSLVIVKSDLVLTTSDTAHIESDVALAETNISDIESSLVIVKSDIVVLDDLTSDVHSSLVITKSQLLIVKSDTSDLKSGLVIVASDLVVIDGNTVPLVSGTSDSGTTTTMVDAARTEADSDYWKGQRIRFTSGNIAWQTRLITGFNATTDTITFHPAVTQAVTTQNYVILPGGGLEAIYSDTTVIASDTALAEGNISDIESSLVIVKSDLVVIDDLASDIHSSLVIAKSDTSDIRSALVVVASDLLQVYSDTTVIASDTALAETNISDIESSLVIVKSDLVVLDDLASDIHSSLVIAKSDTAHIESDVALAEGNISDIESSLVITKSDLVVIDGRLPTSLVGGKMDADARAINSVTAAAVRLALSAGQIIPFTVTNAGFTPTTTEFEASDITEATADHYNGCVVLWTSGALAGQRTEVSDYALSGGRGHFTVVAMTEAPANGDTGVLV